MEKLTDNQSIIITLDVDPHLFDKLTEISSAGFTVVEINTSREDLLCNAMHSFPRLRLGAGNIITTQQLEDCYQAGVHFASSPGFLAAIAQTASIYSMNYLPGVATISEAMQAFSLGIRQVKPFPANLSFCTLLNKYLPELRLYPAEIEWDEIEHYLSLPSVSAISIINPEQKQLEALSSAIIA